MSGRRQHFLPRFLQRQFRSRRNGEEEYVYVFRRDRTYESNLMGVGQERDFYGNPNSSALDAAITAGESKLAAVLATLNEGSKEVPAELIATLVSAISIRTKAMREALVDLLPTMLVALRQELTRDARLLAELQSQLSNDKWLDAQIAQIQSRNIGRNERAKLKAQIRAEAIRNEQTLLANVKTTAARVLDVLDERAAAVANDAYIKALLSDPLTPKRAEKFANFHFDVVDAQGDDFFILGDCGVTAAFSDGKERLALGAIGDGVDLEAVMLPISPSRCLIGTREQESACPSVEAINEASAKLSCEFFISDRHRPSLEIFQQLINTEEPIETPEVLISALVGSR
jgi:hypothetical protein